MIHMEKIFMRSLRKMSLAMLWVLAILALTASASSAQGLKIGFVRDDVIKQNYPAWQRAQEQWELESKAWDEEAVTKQTEIEDLLEEYEKQKLILSEEKRREKEASIRAKQDALDAYTRQIYGPGGTAERKHDGLLEPLLQKATAAIEAVAIEGDYDVIFTLQSGLGYIKESYDVTDKVLEYLEKE
jgi:outer membrane protein